MLILTRSVSQKLMIGADIVITIIQVRGKQVRIGIEAPRAVPVHRDESHQHSRAMTAGAQESQAAIAGA